MQLALDHANMVKAFDLGMEALNKFLLFFSAVSIRPCQYGEGVRSRHERVKQVLIVFQCS